MEKLTEEMVPDDTMIRVGPAPIVPQYPAYDPEPVKRSLTYTSEYTVRYCELNGRIVATHKYTSNMPDLLLAVMWAVQAKDKKDYHFIAPGIVGAFIELNSKPYLTVARPVSA